MSITKHILISYITDTDLDNEVKEYESILNYIGSYFKEKDYHYVIAREPVISEKLTNSIPKSLIKEKIRELKLGKNDDWNNEYYIAGRKKEAQIQVLEELLKGE